MVKDVLEKEFKDALGNGVQLLNFHATWCGPCKMLSPVLEEISEKMGIDVFKVDVEQDRSFAIDMQVQGTPTTFFYKDGVLISKIVGWAAYEQFEEAIKSIK